MSLMDKVVSAVTPSESEQSRQEARSKARAAATPNDWLSLVLQQHLQIEAAFDAVKSSRDAASRMAAQKRLAVLLTGHSNAEESVLYPALVHCGEKAHATMSFTEQAAAKTDMGELEYLDCMSQDYLDKLEHIRVEIAHHIYEEEGSRFTDLKSKMPAAEQTKLTQRFKEEFDRYMGADAGVTDGYAPAASTSRAPAQPPNQPYSV